MEVNSQRKNSERDTAIKLLNQYADRYKALEKENNILQVEIKDLKFNLQFNKEMLNKLMNNSNIKQEEKDLLNKISIENNNIRLEKIELMKKNLSLENQNELLKNNVESIAKELDEKCNKIFLLEQTNFQQASELTFIKKKYFKILNENNVVIDPNQALMSLKNELDKYKEVYENLAGYLLKHSEKMQNYEFLINDLQKENGKLRTEKTLQVSSLKKEKENLLYKLQKEMSYNEKNYINTGSKSVNYINSSYSNNINVSEHGYNTIFKNDSRKNIGLKTAYKNNDSSNYFDKGTKKYKEYDSLGNINLNNFNQFNNLNFNNLNINNVIYEKEKDKKAKRGEYSENMIQNEEFIDILKSVGLSVDNFVLMSKHKTYAKLVDVIEIMYKLLNDKNNTINLLELENNDLNEKNNELIQENNNYATAIQNQKNNSSRQDEKNELNKEIIEDNDYIRENDDENVKNTYNNNNNYIDYNNTFTLNSVKTNEMKEEVKIFSSEMSDDDEVNI